MKNKIKTYGIVKEVDEISLNTADAIIDIRSTNKKEMSIESSDFYLSVKCDDGKVFIKQSNFHLIKLLRKRAEIKIEIPEHIVPSITADGNYTFVKMQNCIFNNLVFRSKSGGVDVDFCSFNSVDVMSKDAVLHAYDMIVKTSLICNFEKGECLLDETFVALADIKSQTGNVGAVNLKCKDGTFSVINGNITATLNGSIDDYSLSASVKEGACDCVQNVASKPYGNIKAYVSCGNISIDFSENETTKQLENL